MISYNIENMLTHRQLRDFVDPTISTEEGLLMRVASVAGRATILTIPDGHGDIRGVDVARASEGRFGPDIATLYRDWDSFRQWSTAVHPADGDPVEASALDNPAPAPEQVFAIGINYLDHAAETGGNAARDIVPPTFTKFSSSLAGPYSSLVLPSEKVDWEVELVAVIGQRAESVSPGDAWAGVAGLAGGQEC